jgi:hypothetical protein
VKKGTCYQIECEISVILFQNPLVSMETCNKTQQIVVRIACHLSVIMGAVLNLWVFNATFHTISVV